MNNPDPVLPAPVESAPLAEVRDYAGYPGQYFQTIDAKDRVHHVFVSRVTYDLRQLNAQGIPALAEQQEPLVDADQFYGQPNLSSCIQESDYAPYKPKCDYVLANAIAHTLDGKPAKSFGVGMRIGESTKFIGVTGPRTIYEGILGWKVSEPAKTVEVPIVWENAYGGACQWPEHVAEDEQPEIIARYLTNPIGCGWVDKAWLKKSRITSMRAPQIEVIKKPFTYSHADAMNYPSVGVGPVGRWWTPRRQKAGTYDQDWRKKRWPRLPGDFDYAYWCSAPEDQQIPFPQGEERVVLVGLVPGVESFQCLLPPIAQHAVVRLQSGPILGMPMNIDTLVFDLKLMTLSCVYRVVVPAIGQVRVLEIRAGRLP